MQAGRRIQHHMPGRQLGAVLAVGILDDQFAAVVFIRPGQEQRAGQVGADAKISVAHGRSEEHTSELQSLMRSSYAVFCLKKKTKTKQKKKKDEAKDKNRNKNDNIN